MKQCPISVLVVMQLIVCTAAESVFAGVETEYGVEMHYWKTHSIIAAVVDKITRREDSGKTISLSPRATIAGHFDPSVESTIDVGAWFGIGIPAREPPVGSTVLVLISEGRRGYYIPAANITFMPEKSAILIVNGVGDPNVERIRDKVQKIRANKDIDADPHVKEEREQIRRLDEENQKLQDASQHK